MEHRSQETHIELHGLESISGELEIDARLVNGTVVLHADRLHALGGLRVTASEGLEQLILVTEGEVRIDDGTISVVRAYQSPARQ